MTFSTGPESKMVSFEPLIAFSDSGEPAEITVDALIATGIKDIELYGDWP